MNWQYTIMGHKASFDGTYPVRKTCHGNEDRCSAEILGKCAVGGSLRQSKVVVPIVMSMAMSMAACIVSPLLFQ